MTRDDLIVSNRLMALWLLRHDKVCRVLSAKLHSHDAESAALYALVKAADCFDPTRFRTFSPLLTRCVRNELGHEVHKALKLRRVKLRPAVADNEPAREPRAHELDERETVARLVKRLMPRERRAIRLYHWEGLTLVQVAEQLGGVSKERVRQLLRRAYTRMRRPGRAG